MSAETQAEPPPLAFPDCGCRPVCPHPPWSDPDHEVAGDYRAALKKAEDTYVAPPERQTCDGPDCGNQWVFYVGLTRFCARCVVTDGPDAAGTRNPAASEGPS